MEKKTITFRVSPKTLLDQIFTKGLPVNSFIDKGRCAIGATYGEIMFKQRCTIIVVPNISILLSKKESHPELDIVYGDVSNEDILKMFATKQPGHKIMTTPEGMRRIMKAAHKAGRLEEVYSEWFLLLDEAHTFISEHYREDILVPFKYFWNFKNKSIISATPYEFTDERFKQLQHYKIEFTEALGTVNVINAKSVVGLLNWILKNLSAFLGNIHIMYNSVTEIRNAILRSGLKDCNIYCADDELRTNMEKLGDLVKHYVAEPKTGTYKKVNFYTCKYFEGWDLYDKNATIILITDVYKEHTMVGVGSKGKQAIGRLRDEPFQIIHITNHKYIKQMKPLKALREHYLDEAKDFIKKNEAYIAKCNKGGFKPTEDKRLEKYCDVDKTTKLATINLMKLDQQINQAANNEIYNNIDFIEQDWRDAYFNVESEDNDIKLDSATTINRKSAAKQLEEDYLILLNHKQKQQESKLFSLDKSLENSIKVSNPTAYNAFKLIDEATMVTLKYNVKKVQAEIILKENNLQQVKFLRLIGHEFKVGSFYSNEEIKSKLQGIYNKLNIRDKTGNPKVATASQIRSKGLFEADDTKRRDAKGNEEHGKLIIRAQFNLRMAA